MAYLEFEAMGVPRVKTERSVAYIDHNTLQSGFENADDHRYHPDRRQKARHAASPARATASATRCIWSASAIPARPSSGRDSHTPTGGGIGMLAMGAGGLDVAVAMGGGAYYITMPQDGARSI